MPTPLKPNLKVISGGKVPQGASVTPAALMPKVLCCIEGASGTVYRGGEVVKSFRLSENALIKFGKVKRREFTKATRFLKAVSKGKPVTLRERP